MILFELMSTVVFAFVWQFQPDNTWLVAVASYGRQPNCHSLAVYAVA